MKRLAVALVLFLTLCNVTLAQFNGCPAGFCGPAIPAFVINQANPPDLAFNWVTNQAWNKSTGVSSTASSLITTVRAAPAAYVNDAQGNWTAINANLPRLSNLGLLVEESRTNSIRNNSAQGTVAGSPGTLPTNWAAQSIPTGLVRTVVGTGTTNGVEWVEFNYSGTTSAAAGAIQIVADIVTAKAIAAANGQVWSNTCWFGVTQDDPAITSLNLDIWQYEADGTTFVGLNSSANLYAGRLTWQRVGGVTTLSAGATTAFIQPMVRQGNTIPISTAVNFSFRIGWPQLELGASVSSPTRTTNAAVTRAADVITLTTPPAFGSAYSLYGKGRPQTLTIYSIDQVFMQVDNGTGNDMTSIRRNAGGGGAYMPSTAAGVSNTSSVSGAAWAQNTSGKLAGAMASGDQNSAFNAVLLGAQTGTLPATPTNVRVGSIQTGAAQWNGFLEYSAIWTTQRVSNAELQSMTTP